MAALEDVDLPPAVKTLAASMGAGLFRIVLMPVDAVKTIMQVRRGAGRQRDGGKEGQRSGAAEGRGGGRRTHRC